MKRIYVALLLSSLYFSTTANDLAITNVSLSGSDLTFDISWENSWRSGLTFHDAVWIFVKQAPNGGPSWEHANISSATASGGFETIVPADNTGVFIRRSSNGNGFSSTSVTLSVDNPIGIFQDFKVMGVEMVYVPEGSFWAGDGVSNQRIHPGDDPAASFEITGEGLLTCGTSSTNIGYNTATCDDLLAPFPKGYDAFYTMKYGITQGQYVDFLNCLPRKFQEKHIQTSITILTPTVVNYYVMCDTIIPLDGNVIRCDEAIGYGNINFYCDRDNDGIGNEDSDAMFRAINYLCVENWVAYLDWSGLRPISFLEYEKACRGPLTPVPHEYSWGSTLNNAPGAIDFVGTNKEKYSNSGIDGGISTYNNDVVRVGCNAPGTGATRELSNASYYGISSLGNNPGDFYLDRSYGSSYTGKHGDGQLSLAGYANETGWPTDECGSFKIKISSLNNGLSAMGTSATGVNLITGGRGVRSL